MQLHLYLMHQCPVFCFEPCQIKIPIGCPRFQAAVISTLKCGLRMETHAVKITNDCCSALISFFISVLLHLPILTMVSHAAQQFATQCNIHAHQIMDGGTTQSLLISKHCCRLISTKRMQGHNAEARTNLESGHNVKVLLHVCA